MSESHIASHPFYENLRPPSEIDLSGGDTARDKAREAWDLLGTLQTRAEVLGGRELWLILDCARHSLRRRWGPFER
ncbi:hypothetical protein F1188_17200 [Roseospira marina]|uniref:Uncharacterized protein n=1 Tax=Roseospira marina TaxID=140057 RepID=A0A5M6I7T3_9PROT|nr:hypothetical protein [Roseospira marina]KAA5604202.1 hypothetical protein F1188_17200 [Roseospira marina]MBB4315700.1 hypothetical protein [Roseospira marina]MBB5088812.1 hypothetical protein [Roseospira marina]